MAASMPAVCSVCSARATKIIVKTWVDNQRRRNDQGHSRRRLSAKAPSGSGLLIVQLLHDWRLTMDGAGVLQVGVTGCVHGELDRVYERLAQIEERREQRADLLLVCGDFQACRTPGDLQQMSCPEKYRDMHSFYKYYSGQRTAPVLTILIGGNHEASNYNFELYFGGWVAPNMYYLGNSGCVRYRGLRIAGISGVYYPDNFNAGYQEDFPLQGRHIRSIYHTRQCEIFKLMQLTGTADVFMSHDWPQRVTQWGDRAALIAKKPHLEKDIATGVLGNPYLPDIMDRLQPNYWFSAHLHCRFDARVPHGDRVTSFMSYDKPGPNRKFMDMHPVPVDAPSDAPLCYDPEWLAIQRLTAPHLSVDAIAPLLSDEVVSPDAIAEETQRIRNEFGDEPPVPANFTATVPPYTPGRRRRQLSTVEPLPAPLELNPQTYTFMKRFGIADPFHSKWPAYKNASLSGRNVNVSRHLMSTLATSSIRLLARR
ncbi:unnamed protein product (mitochondrion) [Plasmodiophora brassicae]|uniref:Lariat debranching enzyme C-terminal domain-containing protein n=1 Tax=Plasmodiophora brassicae TaxID=37360 RepID=A0A3P3YBG1_PLABS|nr:unnamed protein product [Plasmodiophora brassicae]